MAPLSDATLRYQLSETLTHTDIPGLGSPVRGRSRDAYRFDDWMLLVATDRVTVHGTVVGTIPFKGEVLTRVACMWFDEVRDLVPLTVEQVIDPQALLVRYVRFVPVRFTGWSYLVGVLAEAYAGGQRRFGDTVLPEGLSEGEALATEVIVPSLRHERRFGVTILSEDEAAEAGLHDSALLRGCLNLARSLMQAGRELAKKRGLEIAGTTYRFGQTDDGLLTPVSALHTPDWTRYWLEEEIDAPNRNRFHEDTRVEGWLAEQGWDGDSRPPRFDEATRLSMARDSLQVANRLFDGDFRPHPGAARTRLSHALSEAGLTA